MIFFRKIHKWLGLIIGAQVLIWLVSGLLLSLIDQDIASGSATRQASVESPSFEQFLPLFPTRQLPIAIDAAQGASLVSFRSRPVYRIVDDDSVTLYDAKTGRQVLVDELLALDIARDSYTGTGTIISSARHEQGSAEMRSAHGPLWQVNFNDSIATRAYVSAEDGRVLAHRNSRWAVVDFLLMLHFMDYLRADSFNNPQIIALAFCTLWLAISGLLLVFYSFSRGDFTWLPGGALRGKYVPVLAKSNAGREQNVDVDSALSFYAGLALQGIKLPSDCDGSGSCGRCKIKYLSTAPQANAVDRQLIGAAQLSKGYRLACQHKPSSDAVIVVPGIAWQERG